MFAFSDFPCNGDVQMALTVEKALRETIPGSVLHVSSAVKLLDVAQDHSDSGPETEAAAQLCQLAVLRRYGDVGPLFPRVVQAYLESDAAQW